MVIKIKHAVVNMPKVLKTFQKIEAKASFKNHNQLKLSFGVLTRQASLSMEIVSLSMNAMAMQVNTSHKTQTKLT